MDKCATCKYFRQLDESGGHCMHAPPNAVLIADPSGAPGPICIPTRPPVAFTDYCSRHETGIIGLTARPGKVS